MHPWLVAMMDDESEVIAIQKAAQMGVTEAAVNRAFFHIDIAQKSVLYTLPNLKPDAYDFSSTRFDPALEESPHLNDLFSDVKNSGVKRAGSAVLFIRGSKKMKSLPVSHIIYDEIDEFTKEDVRLIYERVSGQEGRVSHFKLSTPTIDNHGVNLYYKDSDQKHFMFRCPGCRRLTELTFPECLVVTADMPNTKDVMNSYLQCKECKVKLPHELKHEWLSAENTQWIPNYTDRIISGYHINQMYSFVLDPYKIANYSLEAQMSDSVEREFMNSKMGLTHSPKGGRITDAHIEECIQDYDMVHTRSDAIQKGIIGEDWIITIGIDVGKICYVEVSAYQFVENVSADVNLSTNCKVLLAKTVERFEDMDKIMLDFNANYAVIDGNPELRKSLEFCQRWMGLASRCFYAEKGFNKIEKDVRISAGRTQWLDMSLGRVMRKNIGLPRDISFSYKEQLKAQVRISKTDKDGNPVSRWVNGEKADHYGHARNYAELALKTLYFDGGENEDATDIY